MNLLNQKSNRPIVMFEGDKSLINAMDMSINEIGYMFYITFKNKYISYRFINPTTLIIDSDEMGLGLKISLVNAKGDVWYPCSDMSIYIPISPIREKSLLTFGFVYISEDKAQEDFIELYKKGLI